MYLKPHKSAHEVPWTIGYIISSRLFQIKCATHNLQPYVTVIWKLSKSTKLKSDYKINIIIFVS